MRGGLSAWPRSGRSPCAGFHQIDLVSHEPSCFLSFLESVASMGSTAVEKMKDELCKEIDELQHQQCELTKRLRDPRGIRRGGSMVLHFCFGVIAYFCGGFYSIRVNQQLHDGNTSDRHQPVRISQHCSSSSSSASGTHDDIPLNSFEISSAMQIENHQEEDGMQRRPETGMHSLMTQASGDSGTQGANHRASSYGTRVGREGN